MIGANLLVIWEVFSMIVTTISEGMKRALCVFILLVIVLFSGFVVKTHWDYEEKCVGFKTGRYPSGVTLGFEKKSVIKEFWDEELVRLGCRREYYGESSSYKFIPPSYNKIIKHHLLVVFKYLISFLLIIVLPFLGFIWIKKGFMKS